MFHLLLAIIYLSFISLGLPDALLGSAWPVMYGELAVPVSYAGMISMIIAVGTIISSLLSDWLTCKLGTGKVTAISVAMTAAALFGFSTCNAFWMLCLWAIPYGLGAGSVDASLNIACGAWAPRWGLTLWALSSPAEDTGREATAASVFCRSSSLPFSFSPFPFGRAGRTPPARMKRLRQSP